MNAFKNVRTTPPRLNIPGTHPTLSVRCGSEVHFLRWLATRSSAWYTIAFRFSFDDVRRPMASVSFKRCWMSIGPSRDSPYLPTFLHAHSSVYRQRKYSTLTVCRHIQQISHTEGQLGMSWTEYFVNFYYTCHCISMSYSRETSLRRIHRITSRLIADSQQASYSSVTDASGAHLRFQDSEPAVLYLMVFVYVFSIFFGKFLAQLINF